MPSPLFLVKLHPDKQLHQFTLGSGVLLTLIGAVLILMMDVPMSWRTLGIVVWLLDCALTLYRLVKGFARVKVVILDSSGSVITKCAKGGIAPQRLQSGSRILARIAWLRLKDWDGQVYAGLFIKSRVNAADWHRLQLLWQQSRRAFGHTAGP